MADIDLTYLFGLKPEEAIRYLEKRGKNFVYSWDWHEVWKEKHTEAFTVAKVMKADILQDIHDALQEANENGSTYRDFANNLKPLLKAKGWWGEVVNEQTGEVATVGPYRLRTIFDVNIQTGYMAGHYQQNMQVAASRPWWRYVAVMDRRTRPSHAALNGLAFRYDDPFWDTHHPPNGWRCRCHIQTQDDEGLAELVKAGEAARRSTDGKNADATMTDVEKPLNRQEMTQVRSVSTRALDGSKVSMAPDAGWDYNPGKRSWQPDLAKYTPEIRAAYEKEKP